SRREPERAALRIAVLVGAEEDERPTAALQGGDAAEQAAPVPTTTRVLLAVGEDDDEVVGRGAPSRLGSIEQQRRGVEERRVAARDEFVLAERHHRREIDVVEQDLVRVTIVELDEGHLGGA